MYDDTRAINPLDATPETSRVVISNYTCMAVTTIVIIARGGLNLKWKRKLGLDDLLLYLALTACVTESVLIHHAVNRGLGTYIRPGNSAKLQRLSEIIYASDLFYLLAMFLAKMSVVRLVYRFASRAAIAKGKLLYLQIFIAFWAAFSFPAIAFECGPPLPWLYIPSRCYSGALWYPVLVFNILTDLWLAVCAWSSLPELQIGQKQRQIITGLFALRVITCLLTVIEIGFLAPALTNINQPRAMPNPTVLKSFVLNASIITAALPLLNRSLAQYKATPSAQAMIYPSEERAPTTPLQELKTPSATYLPNPAKFDGFVKETEVKWQSLIEANVTVKTTDDYLLRLFAIAFTKRRPNQIKKTTYAASSQIRAIRKKMTEIIQREASTCTLAQLTGKLIPEVIGREIEKSTQGIYPLQNVHIRKVKLLKSPKFDLGALLGLHGESSTDDAGQKIQRGDFKEPEVQESV